MFVSRQAWEAQPPKRVVPLDPAKVTKFFVHHTTGSQRPPFAWMRSIQRYHQQSKGWHDIAYSFLVSSDGTVFEGRGWEAQGGHTKGHNSSSVAVAYLGDGRQPVPEAVLRSIRMLADEADELFGRRLERLGHRDVGATACPGTILYRWVHAGMPLEAAEITPPETSPSAGAETPAKPSDAHSASQRVSIVPDLRDGWLRHLDWIRRRH
jgi:hypothetical protein